ncbi:MAG: response regulator transcription factor [Chitinophagaceae bacterium]|nr:MAG: response regulator transcription factor [Chitinophagaceae bacterium]
MIRIAIAEDNPDAVKALLDKLAGYADVTVQAIAANGHDLLQQLEKDNSVDLILMDIEMPGLCGIDATAQVKTKYPNIKIVIITIYDDDENIFKAILAGADSYILKETSAEKIYEAINDTLNGGAVMSPSIAVKALQAFKKSALPPTISTSNVPELSARETQVLEYLSTGLTNKRIAEQLFISPFTVKRHIENIYKKLQAQTRVDLVEKARRSGLL